MKQRWIRLFQLSERSWLEESLNLFLRDHPDSEITVWSNESSWCAQVIYSYPDSPTYSKPEEDE